MIESDAIEAVEQSAHPLVRSNDDYDPLLELVGDRELVLLGEATHGTHEFYRARAAITRRLIREKGFSAVAVEADWPDAYRVNRYIRGMSDDRDPADALDDFTRFPLWMWRNREIVELTGWLREHNERLTAEQRVGFYGLDLYSLYRSIAKVIEYLERIDPDAAERARAHYLCFDHRLQEAQQYGFETSLGVRPQCQEEAVTQLLALQREAAEYVQRNGLAAVDEQFQAEQNARLVKNAEQYYRAMFSGRINTWNLRDRHMADTLDALGAQMRRTGRAPRIVVWAHNSHIGDARATDRADIDELNIGQLVRERHGANALLVGFTTYTGTVAAASEWGGAVSRKHVLPSRPDSHEHVLHSVREDNFFLSLSKLPVREAMRQRRLERAIGVIYLPESELASHYFEARASEQFDAIFHFDRTRALTPLDFVGAWSREEAPQTYPYGE